MKDVVIYDDPALPLADRAVAYLLGRCQHDANLRYHMLHTQAFNLLCQAEAARLGLCSEAVEKIRSVYLGDPERQEPDVVRLRYRVEELENQVEDASPFTAQHVRQEMAATVSEYREQLRALIRTVKASLDCPHDIYAKNDLWAALKEAEQHI